MPKRTRAYSHDDLLRRYNISLKPKSVKPRRSKAQSQTLSLPGCPYPIPCAPYPTTAKDWRILENGNTPRLLTFFRVEAWMRAPQVWEWANGDRLEPLVIGGISTNLLPYFLEGGHHRLLEPPQPPVLDIAHQRAWRYRDILDCPGERSYLRDKLSTHVEQIIEAAILLSRGEPPAQMFLCVDPLGDEKTILAEIKELLGEYRAMYAKAQDPDAELQALIDTAPGKPRREYTWQTWARRLQVWDLKNLHAQSRQTETYCLQSDCRKAL